MTDEFVEKADKGNIPMMEYWRYCYHPEHGHQHEIHSL